MVAIDTEFAEARRARAESAEFEWSSSPSGTICANRVSRKVYIVSRNGCTCGDWTYRGSKVGLKCKHQVALALRELEAGR